MQRQIYVVKHWLDGRGPVAPARPLFEGVERKPPGVTAEGVNAVAAALAAQKTKNPS